MSASEGVALFVAVVVPVLLLIALCAFDPWTFRLRRAAKVVLQTGRPLKFPKPLTKYGYVVIDRSEYGILWDMDFEWFHRLRMHVNSHRDEGVVVSRRQLVEVVDPSTGEHYYLPVPPWSGEWITARDGSNAYLRINTAAKAVAWTFGLHERDYNPVVET